MGQALIQTATSTDPKDVTEEVIFVPDTMPPEESGPAAPSSPAAVKESEPAEIAELDFIETTHVKTIPLSFPFRLDGRVVSEIKVRRLRIGDVDRFIQKARGNGFSTFDVYAEMTGFPVAVLRGLVDEDGDSVTDACFSFLPRILKPEPEPSAN